MTREEQRKVAMTRLNYPPGTRLELISMEASTPPLSTLPLAGDTVL